LTKNPEKESNEERGRKAVRRKTPLILASIVFGLVTGCSVGIALAQGEYPVLDRMAAKVVQKYQASSCQQLAAERAHPPGGQQAEVEQRVIRLLHEDAQMREAFLGRVAVPIANKLFECGMIP
jgi:hypothetical protein